MWGWGRDLGALAGRQPWLADGDGGDVCDGRGLLRSRHGVRMPQAGVRARSLAPTHGRGEPRESKAPKQQAIAASSESFCMCVYIY